jgi:hypothetical protein
MVMRNVYLPIGAVLSVLLVLAAPRFSYRKVAGSILITARSPVGATAQQLAQDESNTGEQPGDNSNAAGDNSDQQNAQPGDDSGDASQANPSDDDNTGESPQMNATPGDSDSDNADQSNQDSDDQQNQQNQDDSQ